MKFVLRITGVLFVVGSLVSCTPKMPSPGGIVVDEPGTAQQVIYLGDQA